MSRTPKSGNQASSQDQQSTTQAEGIQPEAENGQHGVTIYPLRSYLDGKEIRRAGGKGYESPKHVATQLIAKELATDEKPEA